MVQQNNEGRGSRSLRMWYPEIRNSSSLEDILVKGDNFCK